MVIMNRWNRIAALAMTVLLGACATGGSALPPPKPDAGNPAVDAYLIGVDDQLQVTVWHNPDLSVSVPVRPDGKISVPLIGNISARGKTTSQLQGIIRSRLGSEYVKDPQVTVDIQQNRPFFILGEVKNAGQYPYVSGMTVETAVAIGGGYTERASERSFRISRRVDGVVQEIEAPGDILVQPGDTVYVFERYF